MRFLVGCFAFLGATALIAGCGPSYAKVSGKVYYKGEALSSGTVVFLGENDSASAAIGEDGTYEMERAPVGPVKVGVDAGDVVEAPTTVMEGGGPEKMGVQKKGFTATKAPGTGGMKGMMAGMGKGGATAPRKPQGKLPSHVRRPETSNLTFEVKSGNQTHDIKID